jgi:ATP-binding cassette subfamily F protein 3
MIADISISEKSYGHKQLYKDLRFSVQAGEKIGLIGRNGVGKTTLFGLLAKTDHDFSGAVIYRQGLVVASTRQEHHGYEDTPVLEYILHDLPEYAHLKHIIDNHPDTMGDDMRKITEYTDALGRFDDLGYYQIEQKILQELTNFQIDETKSRGILGNLSGGQKRLVEVVKIMHSKSQLALIDEPTNHMDYVAKSMFIDWMKSAREALVVITHDRDVLHEVDRIIEIKDGRAVSADGNYDDYLKQNSNSTVTAMHAYEVGQRTLVNLHKQIQAVNAKKASTSKTPNPFIPLLNRLKKEYAELESNLEKPTFWVDKDSLDQLDDKVTARYEKYKAKNIRIAGMNKDESNSTRMLVEVKGLSLGYADPLFENVHFQLRENERIEFRGRNGAGKTTLIKAILDEAAHRKSATLLKGSVWVDQTVPIGIYEQEVNDKYFDLPLQEAIIQLYLDKNLSISDQKAMQLMGDYLFEPERDGRQLIRQLSGGQKARFQMISMLANDPQLLILDEPTNHLDLPSIEELETALGRYNGAVIYVSHDSYFRGALGGDVIEVAPAA